jgi:hypothetical protein
LIGSLTLGGNFLHQVFFFFLIPSPEQSEQSGEY